MGIKKQLVFTCLVFVFCANRSSVLAYESAGINAPVVDFAYVSGSDDQPGGPAYGFRISRFEIRNDQFAAFLNDALTNLDNPRGAFLFFDSTTGDVYINDEELGRVGSDPGSRSTKLFSPDVGGQIDWVNGRYAVLTSPVDFAAHPVTGVSWYGAVKYCNWLTVDIGLSPDDRAYAESVASNLNGWRPVSITDQQWASRDLLASERESLLDKSGFRLPMDGGAGTGSPNAFDEWFKAASRKPDDNQGFPVFGALFGFGRDAVTSADANFRCSGDPFEDPFECIVGGTSPVGYFDGINVLGNTSPTSANANGYGLYDLSGNVWEWIQDQGAVGTDRRNRGGSFRSSATSLRSDTVADRLADSVNDSTGFRVVQSVPQPLLVTPHTGWNLNGPWGGPYLSPQISSFVYKIENVTDRLIGFEATPSANWLIADYTLTSIDTLTAFEAVNVTLSVQPICDGTLQVGTHAHTVSFTNTTDSTTIVRDVGVTVSEPLTITPTGLFDTTLEFGDPPSSRMYTIENASALPVQWIASWTDTTVAGDGPPGWVLLNGSPSYQSTTDALGTDDLEVSFDLTALTVGTFTAEVTIRNVCTGSSFVLPLRLTIEQLFEITPASDIRFDGVIGGPFLPDENLLTITNRSQNSVAWLLTIVPVAPETNTNWIDVSDSSGTLDTVDAFTELGISTNLFAGLKPAGSYSLDLTFSDPVSGFTEVRRLTLDVIEVIVDPQDDLTFSGPAGGPFAPATQTYVLSNSGLDEMPWRVDFIETSPVQSGLTWIDVSPASGVILNPTGTVEIDVSTSADARRLPAGTYTATLRFVSEATGATTSRDVSILVGTPAFSIPMQLISEEHQQPDGPDYLFRMGKYEVTNTEFVQFLNDTLHNPTTPAAAFITHDTSNRIISLTGDGTVLFDAAIGNQIEYVGANYVPAPGGESLPVVGVSWYGAVKFCNWMTLVQGMNAPDQRVYNEGPTAADFDTRLAASQTITLRGFRLPLDDQQETAAPFNEWFKAAAWIDSQQRNARFGFGREQLSSVDANYLDSNDPAEPGPTNVGFFDGIQFLGDQTTPTSNTSNAYNLYDLSGNVAEWIHDDGLDASQRAVRGGHFGSAENSPFLRNDQRASLPADATVDFVGFRVAQVIEPESVVLSQSLGESSRINGLIGGPYAFPGGLAGRSTITVEVHNPGQQTIDGLSISVDPPWLEVETVTPTQIPPGTTLPIALAVSDKAINAGLSPEPPGDFVLVPGKDFQPNGPSYDFWMGRTEVTNAEFRAFLSLARSNAIGNSPDQRSDFLYFDQASGDVCISDVATGQAGTDISCDGSSILIYDASIGRIQFEDDDYVVETGFENHPVVGVSWYGAIKYCNWLTLHQGLPSSFRAYEEGVASTTVGWHPVVVDAATWQTTGMSPQARQLLIEDTFGYRLPMDDQSLSATPHNEWYKAASRKPNDAGGFPDHSAVYGIGRDGPLESNDANYWNSSDTKVNQTTPVGFFDGSSALFDPPNRLCQAAPVDPRLTRATDNGHGIEDLCGNVSEWTQDFGSNPPLDRATRGGSWRDDATSPLLSTTARNSILPATPADDVGFRVVRGTGHVVTVRVADNLDRTTTQRHYILDLREPFTLEPSTDYRIMASLGEDLSNENTTYSLINPSDTEHPWSVISDQDWIDIVGPVAGEMDGQLADGGSADFEISFNDLSQELPPGEHMVLLTWANGTTQSKFTRTVYLTINEPITVSPTDDDLEVFSGPWGGPFDTPPAQLLRVENVHDLPLNYDITANQTWIDLQPDVALSGVLQPGQFLDLVATINDAANALDVGSFDAIVSVDWGDTQGTGQSGTLERAFRLDVSDPVIVTQATEPWLIGPDLTVLPNQRYTIENRHTSTVELDLQVDVDWLDVDASSLLLLPGQVHVVQVDVNPEALRLFDGEYDAALTIENISAGHQQCRNAFLTIGETLSVDSFEDLSSSGVPGGPIDPIGTSYRITNVARDQAGVIDWDVRTTSPGTDWLMLNQVSAATHALNGSLDDGESATVIVSINAAATATMPPGTYVASIAFTDITNASAATRLVTLRLADPQFPLRMEAVSRSADQPGGPQYSYAMATYPTTNIEFGAFLNDALFNPDNERGAFLYFDTDSGDVFLNDAMTGTSDVNGTGTSIFNAAINDDLFFNASLGYYQVLAGRELHPATGVSWYGALKFANWLTIDQGFSEAQRCYEEADASSVEHWRPITVSATEWAANDLNDAQRSELVSQCRGFRLPMDDGANNLVTTTDQSDEYNEWFKAAAWDAQNGTERKFGFGRNTITSQDANYRDNGDPLDNGTTPVGFFDGTVKQGIFSTQPNENAFGLFDLTGNVFEWMQGRFNLGANSLEFRTARGGSWDDEFDSPDLLAASRNLAPPDFTDGRIGFRVVRVPQAANGDVNGDDTIDYKDAAALPLCMTGVASGGGTAVLPGCLPLDQDEDADVDLKDVYAHLGTMQP